MGLISNGTTIFDAGALDSGLAKGAMTFIKKLTASGSATLAFVHGSGGVDFSTYKEYVFTFNNIHPDSDNVNFQFNGSIDAGSNYNVTKTTTFFRATHNEADNDSGLEYRTGADLAQSTADQVLIDQIGSDNDQCGSGYLHLYNPSSTTFVKNFIARVNGTTHNDQNISDFISGYFNTTSDIDAIRFKLNGGSIQSGDICLYGIA
jgi:hypothetical protein